MTDSIKELQVSFEKALGEANTLEALNQLRVDFLGKKGQLTAALRSVGKMAASERPIFGQKVNVLREALTQQLNEKVRTLEEVAQAKILDQERLDVTLPGRTQRIGGLHPLTMVERKICSIF